MNVKGRRWLQAITITTLLSSHALRGQSTAQITGTVSDPSGAVVTTATVAVVRESTGIQSTAKTNHDGSYSVPLLQPGVYRVEVQAPGFRRVQRSGITLVVAQTAQIDFNLEIGIFLSIRLCH